eukprot:345263-Rhodomonas_salina.4
MGRAAGRVSEAEHLHALPVTPPVTRLTTWRPFRDLRGCPFVRPPLALCLIATASAPLHAPLLLPLRLTQDIPGP